MKKYYLSYEDDRMNLKEYDTENGVRVFRNRLMIYNNTLIINELFDSIRDAIKSLNGYRQPVIYNGENINVWQPDVFVSINRYTGEIYQEYHFDDSILRKYE